MMQIHSWRRALAALGLATLAACGGADAPAPAASPHDTGAARRAAAPTPPAPLTVISSVPGDNGDQTPRDRQPSFTFSALLDPTTVHAGTFALRAGPTVVPAGTRVVDRVAQLLPQARLLPQTRYTVRAEPGLRDVSGQTLAAPVERSFVTADSLWRPIERMTDSETRRSRETAVAIDAKGQTFAAWGAAPGLAERAQVRVAQATAGGAWGDPTLLFDEAGSVRDLKMAADAAGNVLLVWVHVNDIPGSARYLVVWAARFEKLAGRWQAPVVVSHTDGSDNEEVQVAMRPNGEAAVAWCRTEPDTRRFSVWIAVATLPGGRWSIPHRIDDAAHEAAPVADLSLAMAATPGGRTVVAWQGETDRGLRAIWARVIEGRPPGRTPARVISNDNGDPERDPRVVVDSAGGVYVAWHQSRLGGVGSPLGRVWVAHHDADGWRHPRPLSAPDDSVDGPRIATGMRVDGTPSTWVSWIDFGAGRAWVTPVGPDGVGTPRVIAHGVLFHRYAREAAVSLAVDAAGNVRALWPTAGNGDGVPPSVMSSRYVERLQLWSAPLVLDNVDLERNHLQLTVNAVGDGVAAWQASEPIPGGDGRNRIMRTRRFN